MILSSKIWLRIIDLDSITWANEYYSTILSRTSTEVLIVISYEQVWKHRSNIIYIYIGLVVHIIADMQDKAQWYEKLIL